MEQTVRDRLILFIKSLGIGQNKFEKEVGWSNGYISNIKKNIGTEHLTKLLNKYPELSQNWLLNGYGEMIKPSIEIGADGHARFVGQNQASNIKGDNKQVIGTDSDIVARLMDELSSQRKMTEKAQEQIDRLISLLEKLNDNK